MVMPLFRFAYQHADARRGGSVRDDSGADETNEGANRALLKLAISDPDQGLARLFERFAGQVNRWVMRFMGPDADYDDVVQAVFCAMIDGVHQVREPDKLEAWVRSVTVNAVLQELRRRRFRRALVLRAPLPSATRNLVQDIEIRDLLRRAQSLLDSLPAAERVVFILHHAESRTLGEVAEICGFSLATAKRRLSRANERFQRLAERDLELRRLVEVRGDGDT